MLKKMCLLMGIIISIGLPLSADVVVMSSDLSEGGIPRYNNDYESGETASKFILFDTTDIDGLSADTVRAYLKSSSARAEVSSKALAFFYNDVARNFFAKNYELVFYGLLTIIFEDDDDNSNVASIFYFAILGMPTPSRLATRHSKADIKATPDNDDDPFRLQDEQLTSVNRTQLERYFAQNNLTSLIGTYQKGYIFEFEEDEPTYVYNYNYDYDLPVLSINPDNDTEEDEPENYQALMAAGYVLINLEIMSINYNPRTHEVGKVKYRAILAKE